MLKRSRHIAAVFTLVFAVLMGSLPAASGQDTAQAGKTINLQIIVDQSGSMAAATDTGVLRIDAAKSVLNEVIGQIPEAEGVNVGFRVYGHRGNNQPEGQAESCVSSDLLVPMKGVNKAALSEQVNALVPVGWTPLGYALEQAGADFTQPASENVVNAIIMVTDGLETCGADPAAIAGALKNSEAGITTHVIGFGTKPEELAILEGITQASGGQLIGSNNAGQLMDALFEILEELDVIAETGTGEARNSPLGIGRIGQVGNYEVSVLSVINDGDAFIESAKPGYNTPPRSGNQYFVARISATYIGSSSGNPTYDLDFNSVGAMSKAYSSQENRCGTYRYDDDALSVNELFTGGSAEINLCWEIDASDADSLVMYVEETIGPSTGRIWFSLGNPIEVTVLDNEAASSKTDSDSSNSVAAPQNASSENLTSSDGMSILINDSGISPDTLQVPANSLIVLEVTNDGSKACNLAFHSFLFLELGVLPPSSVSTIETSFMPGETKIYCSGETDTGSGESVTLLAE